MRLLNRIMRGGLAAVGAFALASCVPGPAGIEGAPASASRSVTPPAPGGPQDDYPVVLGEPFTIDGITYTPSDTLNFDEVGYATLGEASARGATAAHRTLPMPSYVEVTNLETGRTALMRIERRGPMMNQRMIALSPDASSQLGIADGTPVRVRRVNPPEPERAALRSGQTVPERMETPQGLLDVLKRKLPVIGSTSLARADDSVHSSSPSGSGEITPVDPDTGVPRTNLPLDDEVTSSSASEPAAETVTRSDVVPEASATTANGRYVVQAGAYSSKSAAQGVADTIGGYLEPVGRLWRVRVGPFATRGQAGEALAKVRGAGYTGAQIVTRR